MIQLRPQISLKIDKISKDGICLRIFSWIIFYVVLQIMMLGHKSKYLTNLIEFSVYHNEIPELYEDKLNKPIDQNYTFANGKYIIHQQNVQQLQMDINITILKETFYNLEHTLINNEQILSDAQYSFLVYAKYLNNTENSKLILNETHTKTFNCNLNLSIIQCHTWLEEMETYDYQEFEYLFLLQHHNSDAIKDQKAIIHYENNQYYKTIVIFQVLFLFLIIYAIYYFFNNLSDYPKQIWPKIHQWLQLLLIGMIFYNCPIQLLRNQYDQLVHFYSNLVELLIQSSLFYFWLSIFELEQTQNQETQQQNKFTKWNILKFLLVFFYTGPQALMDTFIFIMKEENLQYDPQVEIPYYGLFLKFVLLSLAGYSCCFIYLLYYSFNKSQPLLITEPQIQDNEINDPYIEGQQMIKQDNNEIRNYKILHILSSICFAALIYYQVVSILQPNILTTSSTINEWSLINIYICMVVQLYMPYYEPYDDDQQKQMYGDIEMEDLRITTQRKKKPLSKKLYTKKKQEEIEDNQQTSEDIQI